MKNNNHALMLVLILLSISAIGVPELFAKKIGPVDVPAGNNNRIESLPPWDEAYPRLRNRIASRFSKDEAAKAQALETLKQYEGVEELIAAEIAEDTVSGHATGRFVQNFIVLSKIRTHRSLEIIGSYLSDDRILQAPSEDMSNEIPSGTAAQALTAMELANAPTPNRGWSGLSQREIDSWRVWWEENKNNLDAALNPPIQAQTQAPPPQAPGTGPNLPPRSEASYPEEEKAPSTPDAANLNVPALLLVILGSLLAAVAAILLRRGRK